MSISHLLITRTAWFSGIQRGDFGGMFAKTVVILVARLAFFFISETFLWFIEVLVNKRQLVCSPPSLESQTYRSSSVVSLHLIPDHARKCQNSCFSASVSLSMSFVFHLLWPSLVSIVLPCSLSQIRLLSLIHV